MILERSKFDIEATVSKAHALYLEKSYEEAEKLYLKSVRRGCTDSLVFKRLGLVYI